MDAKQENNPKEFILTLPHFFITALSEASEKLSLRLLKESPWCK